MVYIFNIHGISSYQEQVLGGPSSLGRKRVRVNAGLANSDEPNSRHMVTQENAVDRQPEIITVSQASERLGLTHARLHQFIRAGRLKVIRPGHEYLIERVELDRFAATPGATGIQLGTGRADR